MQSNECWPLYSMATIDNIPLEGSLSDLRLQASQRQVFFCQYLDFFAGRTLLSTTFPIIIILSNVWAFPLFAQVWHLLENKIQPEPSQRIDCKGESNFNIYRTNVRIYNLKKNYHVLFVQCFYGINVFRFWSYTVFRYYSNLKLYLWP